MLFSLAILFLVGFSAAAIFQKIGLPRMIGMIATGIVTGPYVLDLLDPSLLGISSELRQIALIIILIKAGLSLNLSDLKKVGRPAVMMSFVPASFEIIGYLIFAPLLLHVTRIEAAVMGAVLSAVSPAVVVPRISFSRTVAAKSIRNIESVSRVVLTYSCGRISTFTTSFFSSAERMVFDMRSSDMMYLNTES